MGLFDRKKEGGLMDVIRCDEQEYLVWKWRPSGEANSTKKENSIRWGSSLRVKDGEVAVFYYQQNDGTLMDYIVGHHDQKIETANFPVLTSIVGSLWGGNSPFQAEIYFINLQGNNQIKFGIPYFDVADPRFPDFAVPVAVRGDITFNLTDYKQFIKLNRLIDFNLESFSRQIKDVVIKFTKNFVANCPQDNNIPVIQLERKIVEISDLIKSRLDSIFENDFGVNLKRFDISAIEIDKESENYYEFTRLTKEQQLRRAEIGTEQYERVSKLSAESQFIQAHAIDQQADVLKTSAQSMGQMGGINLGGGDGMNPAGMMMGMAIGGAMGGQMANMMGNMMNQPMQAQQPQQQQMAPPPIPGANVTYMISINGQQYGPYNMQQLQQLVQNGQMNNQTYVWKQGMANWEFAGNVVELASLFGVGTMAPPPPMP
ncbi:MAG: SPFH domain-containing protein [Bacteroidales bacterium]|nr:SPFH domain-containing protein [Bacteroidales bacterium]